MFGAYFVFHYLNMLCVEKQVLEFFATHLMTHENFHDSSRDSPVTQCKSQVHPKAFVTHLVTHSRVMKIFATHLVTKRPETTF